jgi:multidrug efflux pump subunit AcrA (membrane-fusion protein)
MAEQGSRSGSAGAHRAYLWFGLVAAAAALLWLGWTYRSSLPTGSLRAVPSGPSVAAPSPAPLSRVAALGRLEPRRGVIRVAGPPRAAVVIEKLEVEEGDVVESGRVLAVLQGIGLQRAEVTRFRAELAHATRELERKSRLYRKGTLSDSEFEAAQLRRDVARAGLERAQADLELSTVRAPIDGQVLEIHARGGERVGSEGIAELGETTAMYAVAEIYEADIGRVQVGQQARVTSPALPRALLGRVERIGLKVGKKDVLSTDPVADADARVVEVEIRLDDPEPAAALTNLRVDVVIEP